MHGGFDVVDAEEVGSALHADGDAGDVTNPKAGVSIYKAYDVMPVAGGAPLRLGTRDKKSFFTGALDEVAIYPRALTAREIADNYRAGRAG